jgi:hypothetical protein
MVKHERSQFVETETSGADDDERPDLGLVEVGGDLTPG